MIDQVIKISQNDQIQFIGHMEGATSFYVMATERSEYNAKITKMVSLGPIAFLRKSDHSMLKKIADNYQSQAVTLCI